MTAETADSSPVATVVLEVELEPGRVGKLTIRAGDDPKRLAREFVEANGLGEAVEGPLTMYVTRQQMCMQHVEASQTPQQAPPQLPAATGDGHTQASTRTPPRGRLATGGERRAHRSPASRSPPARPAWRPTAQPSPNFGSPDAKLHIDDRHHSHCVQRDPSRRGVAASDAPHCGVTMRVAGSPALTDLAHRLQRGEPLERCRELHEMGTQWLQERRRSQSPAKRQPQQQQRQTPPPTATTSPPGVHTRPVCVSPTRSSELKWAHTAQQAADVARRGGSPVRESLGGEGVSAARPPQRVLMWDSTGTASDVRSAGRPPAAPSAPRHESAWGVRSGGSTQDCSGFFLHSQSLSDDRSASTARGRLNRSAPPRYAVSPTRSTLLKQQHCTTVDWAAAARQALPTPLDEVCHPRPSDQTLFDSSFAVLKESSHQAEIDDNCAVAATNGGGHDGGFGDRLYRNALQRRENHERLRAEYQKRDAEREWAEVVGHRWSKARPTGKPFHPCITAKGAAVKQKVPVHVVLKKRREGAVALQEDDELTECTFHPNLPCARRCGQRSGTPGGDDGGSVFDYLHLDADMRSSRRRFAEELEISRLRSSSASTPMHPHAQNRSHLNSSSPHTARPLVVVQSGSRNVFARLASPSPSGRHQSTSVAPRPRGTQETLIKPFY